MIHLFDIVPENEYQAAVEAKHVTVRSHWSEPLLIHNYTDVCVWQGGWNDATLACRGLITHASTGEVLARPFRKFFNAGQHGSPVFDLLSPVEVTEKLDGSLGITYRSPSGGVAVSTRGSFHSAQAEWASRYLLTHHKSFDPPSGWTFLFEIIYPDNRIVVNYGFEGLVLLGAVDNASGVTVPLKEAATYWGGRVVDVHGFANLGEVLAAPERVNHEGFVVRDVARDVRVKVKHSEYVRLHKLVTETTDRSVWEALSAGLSLDDAFTDAPDELHQWIRAVAGKLTMRFNSLKREVEGEFARCVDDTRTMHGDLYSRGQFAEQAKKSQHTGLLFSLLDGKNIDTQIWWAVKPDITDNTPSQGTR